MKKYLLFCLAIFLLFSIAPGFAASDAGQPAVAQGEDLPGEEIRLLLSQAGSILEQIQMNGWAKVNDSDMSLPALESLAVESIQAMGGGFKAEVQSGETEQIRQVNLQIEQAGMSCLITFQNEEYSGNGEYETYVIVDAVIHDVVNRDELIILRKLEEFLNQFADKPCIRTTYTAAIPGQLGIGRMERISRQIFHGLQGKITEEAHDGGWISKTGYSSKIGCAMESNGKWINLNVALRYNEYEDKTYVWLGTPVISIPY